MKLRSKVEHGSDPMARMIERCTIAAMLALALSVSAAAEVVYNRGNDGDPETLDPHKTSAVAEAHILRDLLEGLVVYNAKAEIVPGSAESWTISPTGAPTRSRSGTTPAGLTAIR
jgi:oligopeptide transport system substrate-binding protein